MGLLRRVGGGVTVTVGRAKNSPDPVFLSEDNYRSSCYLVDRLPSWPWFLRSKWVFG